jgi:hypothetical protein
MRAQDDTAEVWGEGLRAQGDTAEAWGEGLRARDGVEPVVRYCG